MLDLRRRVSSAAYLNEMMCWTSRDERESWGDLPTDIIGCICKYLVDRRTVAAICRVNVHWRDSVRAHVKKVSLRSFQELDGVIAHLPSITGLAVEGDRFQELHTLQMGNLHKLCSLTLTNCKAKRGHPANSIANISLLTGLQELTLQDVVGPTQPILDSVLQKMKGLTSLVLISMSPRVSLPHLDHLGNLLGLRALSVVNGVVDDRLRLPGLSHLPLLGKLHSLHLQGVGLNDTILAGMAASLTCLTRLHLCDEEDVTDAGLSSIARLSSLRVLDFELSASQRRHLLPGGITNQGLSSLSALEGLQELNLSGNPRISCLGLGFLPNLKGLRRLNLTWLPRHQEGSLLVIGQLVHLETLCLAYTLAPDEQLHVVGALTQLRNLDIGFTRAGAQTAASICRLKRLRMLNLRDCTQLRESHILAIPHSCPALEFINVDGCRLSGSVIMRIYNARGRNLRFSHQPLLDDSWDRPLWKEKWLRVFHAINVFCTFMFTSPTPYNVGPNKLRITYGTSSKEQVFSDVRWLAYFCFLALRFCAWVVCVHVFPSIFGLPRLLRRCAAVGIVAVVFEALGAAALTYSNVRRALCLMDH